MNADRRWYREPETFIAVTALIVSISAVAVGLFEAQLQRAHDRAEVWPHVEISTRALGDSARGPMSTTTVVDHALRGGERTTLVGLDRQTLPPHFWEWVRRVAVTICYSSVFNESWVVNDDHLGGTSTWR